MKKKWITGLLAVAILSGLFLPTVTPKAQAETTITYTVQPGDSIWKIATRYQTGVSEIEGANRLANPSRIYPGEKLVIPQLDPKVVSFQNQVVALTNAQRAKYGLKPLKMNWELQRMARYKAEDMESRNYFSHTSPTYGDPFTMMKNFGIGYQSAGENIAAGQPTPQDVVNQWMQSPGHRANILNGTYTDIGCGVSFGGSFAIYWTQEFISH